MPTLTSRRRAHQRPDDRPTFIKLPNHGDKLPGVGVRIKVLSEDGTSMKVRFN